MSKRKSLTARAIKIAPVKSPGGRMCVTCRHPSRPELEAEAREFSSLKEKGDRAASGVTWVTWAEIVFPDLAFDHDVRALKRHMKRCMNETLSD